MGLQSSIRVAHVVILQKKSCRRSGSFTDRIPEMVINNGVQVSIQLSQVSQDGLRIADKSPIVIFANAINRLNKSVSRPKNQTRGHTSEDSRY